MGSPAVKKLFMLQFQQRDDPIRRNKMEDLFISYVSADKALAAQIADALKSVGISSKPLMLGLGDSLAQRVEQGLREADYGALILSRAFFQRPWPRYDLDQLVTSEREYEGKTQLLPIWDQVSQQDIARFSPTLASKVGVPMEWGIDAVVEEIANAVRSSESMSKGFEQTHYDRPQSKVGSVSSDPQQLREILVSNFSDAELRELAFSLNIDYEELSGGAKGSKVIELIGYCQRRGRLGDLEQAVVERRPNLQW